MEFGGNISNAKNLSLDLRFTINSNFDLSVTYEEKKITPNIFILSLLGVETFQIELTRVSVFVNGKEPEEISSNAPILFDKNVFDDSSHDKTLKDNYFLLSNYLLGSLLYRGIYLKLDFECLENLKQNFLFLDGKKLDLDTESGNVFKSLIQLQIVSKIMMYIEDLIIILDSNRLNKNYYYLLDTKSSEDVDVGYRLGNFFNNLNSFSETTWRRILCYIGIESKFKEVDEIIRKNIESIKDILSNVADFNRTHRGIFRRYKHAGFPVMYFGEIKRDFYQLKSDFYTSILVGDNIMKDFTLLPFSEEIIESYKILINGIQLLLDSVVRDRIQCIQRKVDGVIPLKFANINLSESKKYDNILLDVNRKFNSIYPKKFLDIYFNFENNSEYAKQMTWYTNLQKNKQKWKDRAQNDRRIQG